MSSGSETAESSLRSDVSTMFSLMPPEIIRRARIAVLLGAGLAGMEFLAIFLIYPVFGYLTQTTNGSDEYQLPIGFLTIDQDSARLLALMALGLMVLRSLLTYFYRRWWLGVTAAAELQLSDKLLHRYAFAPYAFHLRTLTAELLSRAMTHVNIVCQSGLVGVVGAAADALLIAGLGAALIAVSPIAGITVTIYLMILGLVFVRLTRASNKRLARDLEERYSRLFTSVNVLLRGIRELTIFGVREQYLATIHTAREQTVAANRRVMLLNDLPRAVLEVTLYTTILFAMLVLVGMADPATVLPLVALYVVAGLRITPTVARLLSNIALGRTGSRMARSLVAEIATVDIDGPDLELDVVVDDVDADLSISHVSFSYPGHSERVLSDVTVSIPFGAFCGVVGPSGSGKTTMTSLVLGLFDPTAGEIRYGASKVVAGNPNWFRKVAVLPQDVFLTTDSLKENICTGAPFDPERIDYVIRLSGLNKLVEQLPDGIETPMSEDGSRLSQGQRQRVGLARAVYKNPEILILDEPTSALDSETESHIMASLNSLRGQMTVIAIAHRTQTLANADLVISLSHGTVTAVGPPQQVLPTVTDQSNAS